MGELFGGPESMPEVAMSAVLETLLLEETLLVAVGDVTVATLLELGVVPDVGLSMVKPNERHLMKRPPLMCRPLIRSSTPTTRPGSLRLPFIKPLR